MDEKELERLYNAVNSKFDIGDYNTFRTRMQTPEDRKKFYDVVGSKGFDLGQYPFYEERLSGVKKKKIPTLALLLWEVVYRKIRLLKTLYKNI